MPFPEGKVPEYQSRSPNLSRRELLVGSAALGGAFLLGLGAGRWSASVTPPNSDSTLRDIVGRITDNEKKRGENLLDYEATQDLVPAIVDFYQHVSPIPYPSPYSREDLITKIMVVRPPVGKDENYTHEDLVNQFKSDYPNLVLSELRFNQILNGVSIRSGLVSEEGYIFLGLEHINTIIATDWGTGKKLEGRPETLQFLGRYETVQCKPLTPAIKLRSVLTHELTHYASRRLPNSMKEQEFRQLEQDVFDALKRGGNFGFDMVGNVAFVRNFEVRYDTSIEGTKYTDYLTSLNEFVTDFLASRLSRIYGLPFTPSPGLPIDYVNFEAMLDQSRISVDELAGLYQRGELRSFLLRIAQGSQNIVFPSEEEMMDFTLRIFPLIPYPSAYVNLPRWDLVNQYYPGLDLAKYQYGNYQTVETPKLGCI